MRIVGLSKEFYQSERLRGTTGAIHPIEETVAEAGGAREATEATAAKRSGADRYPACPEVRDELRINSLR